MTQNDARDERGTKDTTARAGAKTSGGGRGRGVTAMLAAAWRDGDMRRRAVMAAIGVTAAVVAVALVVTCVRFISWRVAVSQARARQHELVEAYDFDPGDIIADDLFFDGDAMSEREIQDFLDEQGAQCTGKRCLRTRTFATRRRDADEYCRGYDGGSPQTAAAIIAGAATACGISPKVLLTMLQKEQHLVTDADPDDVQYKSAMGLSCPDDDGCDTRYEGFFNQVFGSAERYQYYAHHEDRYGYHADALNYVRYNPDASCGGSEVYIENRATALLYIYTPYQPNDAALAAGAGEGDACSTYGNRNFALIYSGWFGDPRG